MSHSLQHVVETDAGPITTTFHYNGDLSGSVTIRCTSLGVPPYDQEVIVPAAALFELVGGHLLQNQINKLENLSGEEYIRRLKRF